MNPILYVFASLVLMASSQVMFKKGALIHLKQFQNRNSISSILQLLFQKHILSGLVINFFAAIFWLLALDNFELSYVFPFISLNYIFVPALAVLFFQEKLSNYRIVGIGIICLGVCLIAFS